ncbi:MAG: hypothetical protein J4203_07625 [Candidatus Diapherotrites archaeon]|uniref:Uncharacterized protein n=1 Tax=Candidatus Iainarchaeum sp. TaxID=3101447 RepID=A0A8T4LKF8_9ARCH|nr:hypothetical protein [Candidatus Diapherotrites archaeon]
MPTIKKDASSKTVIYDLLKDLENPLPERDIILTCHLYLEFIMDEILMEYFCPSSLKEYSNGRRGKFSEILIFLGFFKKVNLLQAVGIIDTDLAKGIFLPINSTRNAVSHNLDMGEVTYKGNLIIQGNGLEEYKKDSITAWTTLNAVVGVLLEQPNKFWRSHLEFKLEKPTIHIGGRASLFIELGKEENSTEKN